jgi:hypothetical protein
VQYNGALYTLVTDEGYLETNVVWQTLNDVSYFHLSPFCCVMEVYDRNALMIVLNHGLD